MKIDTGKLYRLPWNLEDNVFTWLEPTKQCDLACEGCYSAPGGRHKELSEIEAELDLIGKRRRSYGVCIAGGEPLLHPRLEEIVALAASRGYRPMLNTNGLSLTPARARALARAGLAKFTFHVDSRQGRPGWEGKSEEELNALRGELASMAAGAGGLYCAFNSTVYPETLGGVPAVVSWAAANASRVHGLCFITYRPPESFGPDFSSAPEGTVTAEDIAGAIRRADPFYEPCAFLGAEGAPASPRWLLALRFVGGGKSAGCAGPRFMKAAQLLHRFAAGTYLGPVPPGRAAGKWHVLGGALFDGGLAAAAGRWLARSLSEPGLLAGRLRMQALNILQPLYGAPGEGRSLCDGCPDMTVRDGRLVQSCMADAPLKRHGRSS